jgi:hypothetical protein
MGSSTYFTILETQKMVKSIDDPIAGAVYYFLQAQLAASFKSPLPLYSVYCG